jgi:pre-rRNA-processing protein IPI1
MELFSWQGDDRYYVFNLKIAEIFLCLSACMDNTIFPADEFCQFVSSLLAKAKTLRNKDTMEKHLSPLITFIPDLVSNAPDDSKGYLLEAFTDAFWDCKVDCKLIFPYLDAVGKMLFPVGSFYGIHTKLPLLHNFFSLFFFFFFVGDVFRLLRNRT